MPTYKAL